MKNVYTKVDEYSAVNDHDKIVFLFKESLMKTRKVYLDFGGDVYDIRFEDLEYPARLRLKPLINKGYKFVFKHDGKKKLLFYNK